MGKRRAARISCKAATNATLADCALTGVCWSLSCPTMTSAHSNRSPPQIEHAC